MYNVDGVMIDIGVQSEKATSGLDKLAATLNKVKTAASGNIGLDTTKKQLEDVNKSLKKWKGFVAPLISMAAITKVFGGAITKSNEYVESMNLFRVALGRYANEAERYADTVERIMGIDSSEWMRNQGTFMQIATGFGMAADKAYTLSKALTQVSYDIASFYNISTKEAMSKVRSGIAGELEPLRNLGYALDTATLQQIAYANGINMKVNAMTQAQKAELRYVAIMSQSRNAINDMSRTFNSSANQIRLLTSQINILARAFGNILIPAINAVLPVIIMFVNALSTALNAIAKLFGFALPSVDWGASGLGDASDAAGGLDDNLGSATGSAKKLKRVLMGFDELNVMPDVGGGGGGGGGGSVGGYGGSLGLELEDYMYDFLDGMYEKVNKINGKMLGIAAAVAGLAIPAATMLGWKNLSNYVGALVTAVAEVAINFKLTRSYLQSGDGTYLLGTIGTTSIAGGIFTTVLRNAGFKSIGGKEWKFGYAAALTLDAGVTLAALYDGIVDGDIKSKKELIVAGIKGVIEAALSGFLLGGWKGAVIGLTVGAIATLAITRLAVDKRDSQLDYGEVTATAEEIRSIAEGMLNIDVDTHLKMVVNAVDGVADAEVKLDEAVAQLQASSNLIRLGIDTSDAAYQSVLNDAQGLIAAANTLLSEQERSLGVMLTLSEPIDKDGNNLNSQLQSAATNAISALRGGYESLGNQLMEAIQNGMDTGEFEAELIANLSGALTRVSSAVTQGEIKGGYVADIQLALGDLDKKSFDGVMDEVQKIQDELRASYTELAKQNKASMEGNLSGLLELQSYYTNIGDHDAAAALGSTIENLRTQLEAFDINEWVDAMMAEATSGTNGIVADALVALMLKGNNSDKFSDEMLNFVTNAMLDTLKNGDYGTFASGLALSIEDAFSAYGIDISGLGFTGADFMTEEFRAVIDGALLKTGLSQATIDQMWEGISKNPVWGKTGKAAAQESIAAIKEQYERETENIAPVTSGMADTIADMLTVSISNAAEIGDYSGVVAAIISMLEGGMAERGMSLGELTFHGTELLTDQFKTEISIALRDTGIDQSAIDQLWETLKSVLGDGITYAITDSKTGAVRAMNDVIADIKRAAKSSTIKLKFGVDSDGSGLKLTGASGTGIDIKVAQTMASGGTVDYGTMFIAGEAGPEIVGQIGRKTGVANSGQISEIISNEMARNGGGRGDEEAIARAVASALSNVRMTVDGDDFGRIAVNTINSRRQKAGRVELIL